MLDLEAIELIKQLKARYFRFMDTGDLQGLKTVFADDAEAYFKGGGYEFSLKGWAELEAFYRDSFTPTQFGMHTGHHPEIDVDGDSATGIWYLQDIFINLETNTTISGSAIYTDKYTKIDGAWCIQYTSYKRLLEQVEQRSNTLKVTCNPITGHD